MSGRVRPVDLEGTTSIHIDVEITEEGYLLFSGQDLREAPRRSFGDSDYEYWLKVSAIDKDHLLLALIETLYSGNPSLVSELRNYQDSRGIPSQFDSF